MREALRPFIRDFGERRLDSFGRDEALTWALAHGRNVQQSVRQFFNHATDRELIVGNPFARIGASKRTRRIDRPTSSSSAPSNTGVSASVLARAALTTTG